eukprot:COSAG02_NODE_3621_length_6458_cov_23.823243_7_plen_111_part_00
MRVRVCLTVIAGCEWLTLLILGLFTVYDEQKLMKRIARGPVRGISLKLQEEERERRMDFVPEVSIVDVAEIEIDRDTKDMLRALDMPNLPNVVVRDNVAPSGGRPAYQRR